jgi:hypothetical protein
MKKVFVVITNAQTWGKSENLFEAIKNAGGFGNGLTRELQIKLVLTEKPENVQVDYIDGGIHYSKGDQIILLNDTPLKVIDFITEREASRIVLAGLDRLIAKEHNETSYSIPVLQSMCEKLDYLENDFED